MKFFHLLNNEITGCLIMWFLVGWNWDFEIGKIRLEIFYVRLAYFVRFLGLS